MERKSLFARGHESISCSRWGRTQVPDAHCNAQTCVGVCASRGSVPPLSLPASRAAGVSAACFQDCPLHGRPGLASPLSQLAGGEARQAGLRQQNPISLTKSKTAKEGGFGLFSGQGRSRRSSVSTGSFQIPDHPETAPAAAPGLLGHPRTFVKRLRSSRAGSGPEKGPLRPSLLPK